MKKSIILVGVFCYLYGLTTLQAERSEQVQSQDIYVTTQDYSGVTSKPSQPEVRKLASSCSSFYQVMKPLVKKWESNCSSRSSSQIAVNQTTASQRECDSLQSRLHGYRYSRSQPDGVLELMPHWLDFELFLQQEERALISRVNSEPATSLSRQSQAVAKTLGASLIDFQIIPGQGSLLKILKEPRYASRVELLNDAQKKIRISDRLANCELLDGASRLSATYRVHYQYELGIQHELVKHAWNIHQKLGKLSRSGLPIYLKWVMYGSLVRKYLGDHHLDFSRTEALEFSKPLLIEDQIQLVPKNLTHRRELNSYYPLSVHKFSKVLDFQVEIIQ
jgi:hypothetical protein